MQGPAIGRPLLWVTDDSLRSLHSRVRLHLAVAFVPRLCFAAAPKQGA